MNSTNCDYILPGGQQANSLCIHYLAFHRDEVPAEELAKVSALAAGEAEPSPEELARPAKRRVSRYEQLARKPRRSGRGGMESRAARYDGTVLRDLPLV